MSFISELHASKVGHLQHQRFYNSQLSSGWKQEAPSKAPTKEVYKILGDVAVGVFLSHNGNRQIIIGNGWLTPSPFHWHGGIWDSLRLVFTSSSTTLDYLQCFFLPKMQMTKPKPQLSLVDKTTPIRHNRSRNI